MPALTEEQKEARRQRMKEQKLRKRERLEQEKADKERAIKNMREVMDDPDSTPAQKIFALEILDNLQLYHFIPYNSFTKLQADKETETQRQTFKEEFAAAHPEILLGIEAE